MVQLVKVKQATKVHPSIRLLRALDVHANDQIALRAQVHRILVGELDPHAVIDALGCRLDKMLILCSAHQMCNTSLSMHVTMRVTTLT
jgi:hypothetical protein